MRHSLLLPAIIILLLCGAEARTQGFEWASGSYGGNEVDGSGLALDSAGNSYVVGTFQNHNLYPVTFGPGVQITWKSRGSYLVKYNQQGKAVWVRTAGSGDVSENGWGVCVDPQGNIYIAGVMVCPGCSFDSVPYNSSVTRLAYLAKYDPNGNLLWARDDSMGVAYDVACDREGNVYVGGIQGPWSRTVYLSKYAPNGDRIWKTTSVGEGVEIYLFGLAPDRFGNCYATGKMNGTTRFDSASQVVKSASIEDVYVVKYGPDGKVIWVRTESRGQYERGLLVGTDAEGNCYGVSDLYSSGFIVKYDSSGDSLWTTEIRGRAYGIAMEPGGGFYLTGTYPGNGKFDTMTVPRAYRSSDDLFLARFNRDGRISWFASTPGNKTDVGYGIAYDRSGNLYVSGTYGDDWVEYDSIWFGSVLMRGISDGSMFIAKYAFTSGVDDPEEPLASRRLAIIGRGGMQAIRLDLPSSGRAHLALYNSVGEMVATLLDEWCSPGQRVVPLPSLPRGSYFARLLEGGKVVAVPVMVE